MRFFNKWFRRKPGIDAATARIDEQVFLLDYRKHYAGTLDEYATPRCLSELFLFRAWAVQFGYRIFTSNLQVSERLIAETINASKYLGLRLFQKLHGFSIEAELKQDFLSLIEDRWKQYDSTVVSGSNVIPTSEIISALTDQLNISDPVVTYSLSIDFLDILTVIKRAALELGVLSAPSNSDERRTNRGVLFTLAELEFVDASGEIVGCDYGLAAKLLTQTFGGKVLSKDLTCLLDDYLQNPCLETAMDLILFDPEFLALFADNKRTARFEE
jgi:hypothetical protein